MEKKINGYKYIGQYADKYYFIKMYYNASSTDIEVYDTTKNQLKVLKVNRLGNIRVNGETISIYNLNG